MHLMYSTGGKTEAQRRERLGVGAAQRLENPALPGAPSPMLLSSSGITTQPSQRNAAQGDSPPEPALPGPLRTWAISRAPMTAAKLNMLPMVPRSSAASWMVLCRSAARSSAEPVQPRMSTASMMDMVWNLSQKPGQGGGAKGPGGRGGFLPLPGVRPRVGREQSPNCQVVESMRLGGRESWWAEQRFMDYDWSRGCKGESLKDWVFEKPELLGAEE